MQTFYWFDFETFGVNPARDRPSQFAGIRTDLDFNIVDEPLNILCKPADDFLPHPEACLVTGITPQHTLEHGMSEKAFFQRIHLELSAANTCAVGYNNIRFDDEVIRFGLYRNFYDAYAREWQSGNSRWDILDMLRMTHALRPQGIVWPKNDEGNTSFRLELLSKANGIEHANAHDALADVEATIAMARLVKQHQPKLFDYLFGLRDKRKVQAQIDLVKLKPFVHCSGMLGPAHQYCAIMLPLAMHPTNKNSVICIDLTRPVDDIEALDVSEIKQRLFTRQADLPEGVERIHLKEIHFNKCPAVAPLGVLDAEARQRLGIDLAECLERAESIRSQVSQWRGKLTQVYSEREFEPINNPDFALYSGGFFSPKDRGKMEDIRKLDWQALASSEFNFDDKRLPDMLFRYRARNARETLSAQELDSWDELRRRNFFDTDSGSTLLYPDLLAKLDLLQQDQNNNQQILQSVREYSQQLVDSLTKE